MADCSDELPGTFPVLHSQHSPAIDPVVWGSLLSRTTGYPAIDLTSDEITFGRRSNCTVNFDDARISGVHCKVFLEGSQPWIQDLSTNGTYVNNKLVGKGSRQLLRPGDEISLAAKTTNMNCVVNYCFTARQATPEEVPELRSRGYELHDEILGTGSFSVVKTGIHRETGEKVAIKIIDKRRHWNSATVTQLERESDILKRIKHSNIIGIHDVFATQSFVYIVMELATGGELFDMIASQKRLSEVKAKDIFRQLFYAILYLHREGIAHRDLKPENILLATKGSHEIKISDFGLARLVDEREMMTTTCGTPQYVAPEVIRQNFIEDDEDDAGYGKEVDVWSLGIILYIVLSGMQPFNDEDPKQLYKDIQNGNYGFPNKYWADISLESQDLIKRMLTVDPKKRITVSDCLLHPWIINASGVKRKLSPPSQEIENRTNEPNSKRQAINGQQQQNQPHQNQQQQQQHQDTPRSNKNHHSNASVIAPSPESALAAGNNKK